MPQELRRAVGATFDYVADFRVPSPSGLFITKLVQQRGGKLSN